MNTQHLYSPCKFIKSTGLHQKIEVKNRVSRPSRTSHRAIFRSRPRYANMDINKVKGHAAGFSAGVMWGLMAPVAKLVLWKRRAGLTPSGTRDLTPRAK